MRTDKALLKYKGRSFVEILYEKLKDDFSEVIISSNNPEIFIPEAKIVSDKIKNIGPAGGIFSGLSVSHSEKNMIVSIDTPLITKDIFNFLIKNDDRNTDVTIISEKNKLHPLTGIYSKNFVKILSEEIEKGNYKIRDIIKKVKYKILEISKEAFYNEQLLLNINTPEDYNKFLELSN